MDGAQLEQTETAVDAATDRRKTKLIGVNCSQRLVGALEAFIAAQPNELTRPEAIRVIVAKWLRNEGYL